MISIGRIVHYTDPSYGGPFPAIVLAVHDPDTVNLRVLPDRGEGFQLNSVKRSVSPAGSNDAKGKWNWPAEVGPEDYGTELASLRQSVVSLQDEVLKLKEQHRQLEELVELLDQTAAPQPDTTPAVPPVTAPSGS